MSVQIVLQIELQIKLQLNRRRFILVLRMTATNVHEIEEGVWSFDMSPHQVRHFGGAASSVGSRSVMIFSDYEFNSSTGELHFQAEDVVAINVGTEPHVIGLEAQSNKVEKKQGLTQQNLDERIFGYGDKTFLRMTKKELPDHMHRAAVALLNGIRANSSGDLKKGQSRNFSDTPDNFWYVIVQPRIEQLSITVRGSVDHFKSVAKLPIKDDRGNTLFKITCEEDVPKALEIIFHAKRKKM